MALRTLARIGTADNHLPAVLAVPDRNPVSPPELAADAPVVDMFQPVGIGQFEALWIEVQLAVLQCLQSLVGHPLHADEPLVGKVGLDDGMATVAVTDVMLDVLHLHQQAKLVQVLDHELPGLFRLQATIFLRHVLVQRAIRIQYIDRLQVVAFAALIVVGVVGRGDLHHAGAELAVDKSVGDDRDVPTGQRKVQHLADNRLVALVIRMHGHRLVAEHGLRTGGCDGDRAGTIGVGIADMPHMAGHLAVLDLVVGQSSLAMRTIVDQIFALIDQAALIQGHECLADRFGKPLVHSEALMAPVTGGSDGLDLLADDVVVLLLDGPGTLQELLTSQILAAQPLFGKHTLDDVLRGDTGMVGSRHPQGALSAHAPVPDEDVLQGIVQGVAHVQDTGDVGRWHDNREGLLRIGRLEGPLLFPGLVNT